MMLYIYIPHPSPTPTPPYPHALTPTLIPYTVQPLEFHCGHSTTIDCMAVSSASVHGSVVCTASSQQVMLWYLDQVIAAIKTS